MSNNLKIFILIIIALTILFLTKEKYQGFSKDKSIQACMIAQKKKFKEKPIEDIKIFCEQEINKNIK
tara:strand:+ start:579 stop:779 length:201 start_codon:yes stop_codon:yes gene_type:complete